MVTYLDCHLGVASSVSKLCLPIAHVVLQMGDVKLQVIRYGANYGLVINTCVLAELRRHLLTLLNHMEPGTASFSSSYLSVTFVCTRVQFFSDRWRFQCSSKPCICIPFQKDDSTLRTTSSRHCKLLNARTSMSARSKR